MPATITSRPNRSPNPDTDAALAELLQLGLVVARVAARLAEMENASLDALSDAAAHATQALATTPASLGDAIRTGREADVMDAVRDAVVARVASITDSFEKSARAVRRTAALQARLIDGRPFSTPHPPPVPAPSHAPAGARRKPANDAESPERADRPEHGDEIGTRTGEELLGAIHQDLAVAVAQLAQPPGGAHASGLAKPDGPALADAPPAPPGFAPTIPASVPATNAPPPPDT